MSHLHFATARVGYCKPAMTRLTVEDVAQPASPLSGALSGMDLLRAVQSAFDEVGPSIDGHVTDLKRSVLAEVSAGRLADALKMVIVQSAAAGADPRFRP